MKRMLPMTQEELHWHAVNFVDQMPRYPYLNEVNREAMIFLFEAAIRLGQEASDA